MKKPINKDLYYILWLSGYFYDNPYLSSVFINNIITQDNNER